MGKTQSIAVAALAVTSLGIFLTARPVLAQNWKGGEKAPDFSGKASDGKTYSLSSVKATNKLTVLYFIGSTCPVNAQAVKYYNNVASAYKGKVNFLGVIDTDKAGYDKWQARFKSPFPVIFDPELKIIESYKAERSPWVVTIDPNNKVKEEWPGYSVGYLNDLGSQIASSAKMTPAKIDTSGAPAEARYG